jgi:hypothetical protein
MIRKLTVALAATAVVGTAALAPSAANATWRGYGWYGHPYYTAIRPTFISRATSSTSRTTFTRATSIAGSTRAIATATDRQLRGLNAAAPTATPVSREPGVGHLR